MHFDALGLKAELLRAVKEQGYTQPTPVQARAIPPILAGHDIMASAQTGTGKTAAFVLPLLQRLSESGGNNTGPRALILAPTRELAAQVNENLRAYGRHLGLRSLEIYGGVGINPQIAKLKRGVDILVATPGRLIDHMQRGTVDLKGVETLVLDEADRMLDMGFRPAIERIVKVMPRQRQTLLFSATFSADITGLAQRYLNKPQRIETAAPNSTVEAIAQRAYRVDQKQKRGALSWLIGSNNWRQVLVFTRTKHGADRLARQLETDGLPSAAIHGNKSQGARSRALAAFKQHKIRVLVATDIAARGLDIDQLPQVVNYEIPQVPDDYVHRIGRTGRAGREGIAVSLVSGAEHGLFAAIRRQIGVKIPTGTLEGFEPTEPVVRDSRKNSQPGRRGPAKAGNRPNAGNRQPGRDRDRGGKRARRDDRSQRARKAA